MVAEEELSPTQQRWWNYLQRAERESLSIRAYAAREGLSAQSLYGFRKRLKRRSSGGECRPALPTFATVQVVQSNAVCSMHNAYYVKSHRSSDSSAGAGSPPGCAPDFTLPPHLNVRQFARKPKQAALALGRISRLPVVCKTPSTCPPSP